MNYIEEQLVKFDKLSLKITCGDLGCIGNKDCTTKKAVESFLLTSLNGLIDKCKEEIEKISSEVGCWCDVYTYCTSCSEGDGMEEAVEILDHMKFNPQGK